MKKEVEKVLYSMIIIITLLIVNNTNIVEKLKENFTEKEIQYKNISNEETFRIEFLDVGQGESILIENNNKYVLIDAGNNKDGKKLVNYFKNKGIPAFQYVIATHSHEDHIGGMDNIIRAFPIEHFFIPKTKTDLITYKEVIEELNKKNIKAETPLIDTSFQVENTKYDILSIKDDKEDLNNTSVILKVTYFNNSFLLMSDATSEIERSILEKDIKSDVLKVSHHGSRNSSIASFLSKVKPKYAVIQVGKNNDYGLPKQVVLDKLERINAKVYRTDKDGTIIMSSNGNEISIKTIETDTNEE